MPAPPGPHSAPPAPFGEGYNPHGKNPQAGDPQQYPVDEYQHGHTISGFAANGFPVIFCPCQACQENTQRVHGIRLNAQNFGDPLQEERLYFNPYAHDEPPLPGHVFRDGAPTPATPDRGASKSSENNSSNPDASQQPVDIVRGVPQPIQYEEHKSKDKAKKRALDESSTSDKIKENEPKATKRHRHKHTALYLNPQVGEGSSLLRDIQILGQNATSDASFRKMLFNASLLAGSAASSMIIRNVVDGDTLVVGLGGLLRATGLVGNAFNPGVAGVLLASVYYGAGTLYSTFAQRNVQLL